MRVRGWETALRAAVERHRALPFGWGTSDCFVFAMDCVAAVTGRDPSAGARDWSDEAGAKRALVAHGFGSVADAFASVLPEIHPAFAGRGDLVAFAHDSMIAGGVCLGPMCAGKGREGIAFLPRTAMIRAFRT